MQLPLPWVEYDGYILTFVRVDGGEFSFCLNFPGDLAPLYPLSRYPRISEFRSMLNEFDVSKKASYWTGYYFAACTSEQEDGSITAAWVVYSKPPFGGPEHVLKYLARYTHRVAISNGRLLGLENGQVSFRWRDSRHNNR